MDYSNGTASRESSSSRPASPARKRPRSRSTSPLLTAADDDDADDADDADDNRVIAPLVEATYGVGVGVGVALHTTNGVRERERERQRDTWVTFFYQFYEFIKIDININET